MKLRASLCAVLCAGLAVAAVCSVGCGGHTTGTKLIGESCTGPGECPAGAACFDGKCVVACVIDADCPEGNEACVDGVCQAVPNPACSSANDCVAPQVCQDKSAARCIGGKCQYAALPAGSRCEDGNLCTHDDLCTAAVACVGTPTVCAIPPANECVQGDTLYRGYASDGSCDSSTGGCDYASFDFACPSCTATCLGRCSGVTCATTNGGCRSHGICVPDLTPYCHYDLATDWVSCDLPGDPVGSGAGHCMTGECIECTLPVDCDNPPTGEIACFTATCTNGRCGYTPKPGTVVCAATYCADGVVHNQRVCAGDGSCPDAGVVDCNGLRCDLSGLACLPSCASTADCLSGFYCKSTSACVPLIADGEVCTGEGSAACQSGYCDGTRCCSGGTCCGGAADCPPSFRAAPTCLDNSNATSCQGERTDATCASHVCGSVTVNDDSGCVGLVHDCPNNFAPHVCTADSDQVPPACLTSCSGTPDCALGFACSAPNCVVPVGAGAACTGTGQGTCQTGLKCDNGLCCAASGPTCCSASTPCNGLTCNLAAYSCFTTCNDFDTSRCATAGTYCLTNACVSQKSDGQGCGNANECTHLSCVDGNCCEAPCSGVCAACAQALTGLTDGLCRPIALGSQDTQPTLSCGTATGCTGAVCACDGGGIGAAHCKSAVGQSCGTGAECTTGICECADSTCSTKKCATAYCGACQYTTTGTSCLTGMGSAAGVDDAQDCTGANACFAGGACKLKVGQPCASGGACGTGICDCGDATCTVGGKKCGASACAACKYTTTGVTCDGNLSAGPEPGCNAGVQACTSAQACDGSGTCTTTYLSGKQSCPTCQTCNGSSATCVAMTGQQDTGCNAAAQACKSADVCSSSGACTAGSLLTGKQSCGTCQTCNGSQATCAGLNAVQDTGCSTSCHYCATGSCTYLTSGSGYGCTAPSYCNASGTCVTQIPDGGTGCTTGSQCVSGNCDTSLPTTGGSMCCKGISSGYTGQCCSAETDCTTGDHCKNSVHACTGGAIGDPCDSVSDCDSFSCSGAGIRRCLKASGIGICTSPYTDCYCDCYCTGTSCP